MTPVTNHAVMGTRTPIGHLTVTTGPFSQTLLREVSQEANSSKYVCRGKKQKSQPLGSANLWHHHCTHTDCYHSIQVPGYEAQDVNTSIGQRVQNANKTAQTGLFSWMDNLAMLLTC